MKRLIEYEKRDEISKRNVKHINKNIKYQTKRMYDEHFEHGCTKPMTKPQYNDKIVLTNLNEHEQIVLRTRIASSKMLTKTKKRYTINHRKAVNKMKKFRQNLKRKGKHVVKCVTKSNIVAQLNNI